MSFLHSIQLGNRADFCRRWDTVALVLQPDTTFCLSITVTMSALMVGGCGSAQPQSKTRDVISVFLERHVTMMLIYLLAILGFLMKKSVNFLRSVRLNWLRQKRSEIS